MKSKSGKSARTPSKTKSRKYPIRNRSLSSTEKDFEKLFDQMKKDILNEIEKAAKDKFQEHKNKIINFINDYKVNEVPETTMPGTKKTTKSKKTKKKGKDNISIEQIVVPQENEDEKDNQITPILTSEKKKTKRKRTLGKKKKPKKKISKKESSIIQLGEKTDASSLNDISKISGTVIKSNKIDKKGNEKSTSDKKLTGKKRKRSKENFVFLFNSEPNYENGEEVKKSKKTNGKKNTKSTKKIK